MNPRDRLLERAARGENISEEAARLVAAKKAAKSARSRRPAKVAARAEKRASREERNARTVNVRVEVFKRDEGRCVVCGAEATDMHHLVYGSGFRRVAESGQTCAAVCRWHHVEAHRGGWATLEALLFWARGRRYSLAADALVRRMDKIHALRVPHAHPTARRDGGRG